ncbi:MAG TPA: FAD:protein FMN transferase [Verrucomicrobiales bacterium]|nr:ApbE family lipoprotein [Verrucomicrobiales bacterium]HBE97615.1 FAD:protein FMN transferase [Verrucomicrobiales bacterium]
MTSLSPIGKFIHSLAVLLKSAACLCLGTTSLFAQKGGEAEKTRQYFSEPHLGTIVQIVFYSEDKEHSQKLAKQCFERIEKLNRIFSNYLPDSEVSQLCAKPVKVACKVSDDLFEVIAQAQEISAATGGAFDITLGRVTRKWREKKLSQEKATVRESQATYQDVVLNPGAKSVLLRQTLKIDLGGIAKGYIADQLMVILKKAGIKQAAVIIGGEMVFTEAPPGKAGWTVGIERPSHQVLGMLKLSNIALSTSGDSYQFFEKDGVRHAHLIDPFNRKPKTDRRNVTILARSAMLADAWATALRVSAPEAALKLAKEEKEIEAVFIPFGKPAASTAGFPKLMKP